MRLRRIAASLAIAVSTATGGWAVLTASPAAADDALFVCEETPDFFACEGWNGELWILPK